MRIHVCFLLSILLVGCSARSGPGPETTMPAADPFVAEALSACRGRLEPQPCYEERLHSLLRAAGVRPALGALEALAAADPGVLRDSHMYAHGIGIAAYPSLEVDVADRFAECTPGFESGCYHGVIQAYFGHLRAAGGGELAPGEVAAPCRRYERADANQWLLFQCLHGVGHGVAIYRAHHLPRALGDCDLLGDDWSRESCYAGAFMETLVNAIQPHHPSTVAARTSGGGAHGAHEAHGGHGASPSGRAGPEHAAHGPSSGEHSHAGAAQPEHAHGTPHGSAASGGAEPFPAVDPENPLHPCTAVAHRYQRACYQMQTSAILHHTKGDLAAAAGWCSRAPEEFVPTCYESLGRDISPRAVRDPEAAIRACGAGEEAHRGWCHAGVAKQLVNLSATAEPGIAHCARLPEEARSQCFTEVGRQIRLLERDPVRRAALCDGAGSPYRAVCRRAAGVEGVEPDA